ISCERPFSLLALSSSRKAIWRETSARTYPCPFRARRFPLNSSAIITPTYGTRQKRNLTDFTRAIRTLPALVCMAFFGSAANGLAGYFLLQVGNPVRDRRLRWKLCF